MELDISCSTKAAVSEWVGYSSSAPETHKSKPIKRETQQKGLLQECSPREREREGGFHY